MRRIWMLGYLWAASTLCAQQVWTLGWEDYENKVHGAWLGQIIGTLLGFEFEGKIASSESVWVDQYPSNDPRSPRVLGWAPVDDDYYYELVALRAFERFGLGMTLDQLGEQWKANAAGSWGSSRETRLALMRGIPGSQTGHPRNNRWWWTIGPQFSADIYGMLAPGNPNLAARLASTYGRINGHAEAVDGAVFVAGMVSLAFRETDVRRIVREAAALIPNSSPYRQCLNQVIALAEAGYPARAVTEAIENRWRPVYPAVNNAVANGGLVAASVWFGGGDFLRTLNLAFRAADFSDADCNAANAGAVVGAMVGHRGLPAHLVEPLNDRIRGERLGDVHLSPPVDEQISDIVRRTVRLGRQLMLQHGARDLGQAFQIEIQPPVMVATERFTLADLARLWNADWELERAGFGGMSSGGCERATYLSGDMLVTWPQDEARGVLLRRKVVLTGAPQLELEVGAQAGCAWQLTVAANNTIVATELIEGASDASPSWRTLRLDLTRFAGQLVELRLYQRTSLRRATAGSAYWRRIELTNTNR